jgi:hypothetical protein
MIHKRVISGRSYLSASASRKLCRAILSQIAPDSVLHGNNVSLGETVTEVSSTYRSWAAWAAILAGIGGFIYSVSFVIISRSNPALGDTLSALFLLIDGILVTLLAVHLRHQLDGVDSGFAAWSTTLVLLAAIGSAVHGGYDLANSINPPATTNIDLPSQIDPRGFLTFGLSGLGTIAVGWLLAKSDPGLRGLGTLGIVVGALSIFLFLARLIILSPANMLVLGPALILGFVLNPLWLIWLGTRIRQTSVVRTSLDPAISPTN